MIDGVNSAITVSKAAAGNMNIINDEKVSRPLWRVSVIVPAYNEETVLPACLQSIVDQKNGALGYVFEIIVADNQSTDSTPVIAHSFGARTVSVKPGNPGRARNAGARCAQGDVLAFVDADCVLPPNWLQSCLEHLNDKQVIASAAPHGPPSSGCTWVQKAWYQLTKPPEDVATVKWLPAFNLIIRRDCFIEINGFDETLRTCEDSDLSFRLSERGTMVLDGRMWARHLGESATLWQLLRREMWRSAGNIASALKRGAVRAEFKSIVVPPAYVFAILTSTMLLGFGTLLPTYAVMLGAITLGGVLLLPFAIAIRKGIYPWRKPILLAQCSIVASTYLVARALGMLFSSKRIELRKA